MLLRTAREQEQAGHDDQALALTGRMEEALRAGRAGIQRRQTAMKDAKPGPYEVDVYGPATFKTDEKTKELAISVDGPATLTIDQARRKLALQDAERAAV